MLGPESATVRDFLFRFAERWFVSDAFGLAAAFAFYTLFAIAPLLAFAIALSAYFLGGEQAQSGAVQWLENLVSQEQAASIVQMMEVEEWDDLNWIYTGLTGVVFLWGASLSFTRLRVAVNIILGNESDSIRHAIRESLTGRALSLVFTVAAGLITALLIVITAGAPGFAHWLGEAGDGVSGWPVTLLSTLFLAAGMIAVLRILPIEPPGWRATFYGTGFFVIAFQLGRLLFHFQMANSELATAYGAANTLVVFLFWVFYSAQALLLGVNLTAILNGSPSAGR